jgi:tetratricopeptide (TPR) repeat protein
MTAKFDPYHRWLGIPADEQPPNNYRLLGIKLFEADQEVIAAAAVQRMNFVRKFQRGEHTAVSQQIFKEVADAWACLLNPAAKQAYDARLKAKVEAENLTRELADIADALPPMAGTPPSPKPPGVKSDLPPELMADQSRPEKDAAFEPDADALAIAAATPGGKSHSIIDLNFHAPEPTRGSNKSKQRKKQSPVVTLAKHAIASVVGLALGYAILCAIGRQYDFLGLLGPPLPPESKVTVGLARSKGIEPRSPAPEIDNEKWRPKPAPENSTPQPMPVEKTIDKPQADEPRPKVREEKSPRQPTARLVVPGEGELRKASEQVAQLYKKSLDAANSEESKAALAKQLFSDADLARDDPARRYVLIAKSRELAIDGGSFNMACTTSAKLGQVFVLDGLELKAAALDAIAPAQVDRHEAFVQTAQGVLEEAAKAERFEIASRVANLAATSIRKWNLSLDWPTAEDAAATFSETADALNAMSSNRNDALANTRFGLFLELVQRNPTDAAKFFDAGGDATVSAAVAKDHGANTSDAQLMAADAWWSLANQDNSPLTAATKLRAIYWYEKALPGLSGPEKTRAQGRALESRMAGDVDDILMANDLESAAKKRFVARDALRLYKAFLANAKVSATEKTLANAKFAYWETAAKEERVRLGDRWVFPAQAEKARADAQSLIDRGINELVLKHSERAIPQWEHASQADPNGTQADFLLGVLHTTGLKNPQQGKINFARASGRDATNVGLLNNVAVAEFMSGDHLAAVRHFQRAAEINPRAPEVRHNLQRIQQLASKGLIPQQAATAYAVRLENTTQDTTKTFDRMGFLFVVPAAYALQEELRPADNPLMARAAELEISGRVGETWVDDRDCVNCRGTGQVHCPDCQNGTVAKLQTDMLIDRRITGTPITSTTKVREKCKTCGGDGSVNCPICHGGGTDTSIR